MLVIFQNDFLAGIFPANLQSLIFVVVLTAILYFLQKDITFGITDLFRNYLFHYILGYVCQIERVHCCCLFPFQGWSRLSNAWSFFRRIALVASSGAVFSTFNQAVAHLQRLDV